jgi:hypothetical protein
VKEDSAQEQARVMAEEARRTAQEAKASAEATGGEQEWYAQLGVIYGGLIGIAVLMVQPFLTTTSLDVSAKISVIAFSVAIPLLAALVMVNRMEIFRRRWTPSLTVMVAKSLAQLSAFVGIVAGFWHILWIAGVGFLAAGLVAIGVHSAGYTRLEIRGSGEKWWSPRRRTEPRPESPGTKELTS